MFVPIGNGEVITDKKTYPESTFNGRADKLVERGYLVEVEPPPTPAKPQPAGPKSGKKK